MNTKLIKQIALVFALMVGALTVVSLLPGVANAALLSAGDNPSEVSAATGGEGSLRQLVLTMVNYFLTFLGIVAVIMIIYGGITYVTAAGQDEAVGNAKKIIMYALVGIIIILLSFAIVNTILGAGTGTEV
jgi:hypothetical protein